MIEYAKFLSTRILNKKSNQYLILAAIAVLLFILVMNIRMQDTLRENLTSQIELTKDEQGEYYETERKIYNEMITAYDNKEWSFLYEKYQEVLEERIQVNEGLINPSMDDDTLSIGMDKRVLTYITYLNDHHLTYTDLDYPIIGLSFITFVSEYISPILILICCIFILAQVFTMDYSKSIDISNLMPMGRRKTFLVKMATGLVTSALIFTLILGIAFLFASIINFNTGINYPIIIKDTATNVWQAVPLTAFLIEWLLLGILFYAASCVFTYFLSLFIKEEGPLFFTSLCIILGIAYLPTFIPDLTKIAHCLPTTYMNFVSVSTGQLASQYGNMSISFTTGLQVLSNFIVVIFILCFCIKCSMIKIKK